MVWASAGNAVSEKPDTGSVTLAFRPPASARGRVSRPGRAYPAFGITYTTPYDGGGSGKITEIGRCWRSMAGSELEFGGGDPDSLDTGTAHIARVYDYWLGGKDHF